MSLYQDYLDGLAVLAREDRIDPLSQAIEARLRGSAAPVAGLVPPPLDRDEPDLAAVLAHLYARLEAPGDARARRRLRAVLVDLVCAALPAAPLDYLDRLGGLIGFCEVREDPELAGALRLRLWGHLEAGLSCPLECLPTLDGEALERASRALDLWVAVLPPMEEVSDHHRKRIEVVFDASWGRFARWTSMTDGRYQVMTLWFRALAKVSPRVAGQRGLPKMVRETARCAERDPQYERRWLGLCWELGILLGSDQSWREKFRQGLFQYAISASDPNSDPPPLFWTSLELLDGLDRDLREVTVSHGLPVQKRKVSGAN